MQQQSRVVNIYLEANPNPNSLKFMLNFMLMPEGETMDFADVESTREVAPLAESLFEQFSFVRRVFYMNNFITVTKAEETEWLEVQTEVKDFIKTYLEEGKPAFVAKAVAEAKALANNAEETDVDRKIKDILEEYIKPAVEQDGGAITYHSFQDGVVKVLLQGSCSGCPSSTITLKAGIENLLKRMVPEVETVEAEGV